MDDYERVTQEYEILVWSRDLVGLHAGELHVVEFCSCGQSGELKSAGWVLVQATGVYLRVVSSLPLTPLPLRPYFPGAAREAVRRYLEACRAEQGENACRRMTMIDDAITDPPVDPQKKPVPPPHGLVDQSVDKPLPAGDEDQAQVPDQGPAGEQGSE